MRKGMRSVVVHASVAVLLATFVTVDAVVRAGRAVAQLANGEYALYQPGSSDPVGWVRVSGDKTVEWWAYVDGTYAWADSSNVASSRWHLDAEYLGTGGYATYATWKSAVLQRPAAQGRTIVFQDHSVTEETVEN